MFPGTQVVTSPHCTKSLRTGKERPCQNERTFGRVRAFIECLPSLIRLFVREWIFSAILIRTMSTQLTYEKHAVYVMYITVFPSTMVNIILRHCDFRTIENRRLYQPKHISDKHDDVYQYPLPRSYRSKYGRSPCYPSMKIHLSVL